MVDFIERTDHSDVIAMALHSFESAFICCNSLKKTFMLDLLVITNGYSTASGWPCEWD